MLPPDFDPGASFLWFVLGLALFVFLLFAIAIYRVALAEEKRIRESLPANAENGKSPKAASGPLEPSRRKLGADGGEIWIADDFDAPLILVEDCESRNHNQR